MTKDLVPFDEDNSTDEEKKWYRTIFIILVVAFILIAAILTFGWFFKEDEKKKKEQETIDKKFRLMKLERLIKSMEAKKKTIEKNEKAIKIIARLGIGALIIYSNYRYCLYYKILPFDFKEDIDKLLSLNAAIVTAYSFVAFISYGSITNFVNRLKEILVKLLSSYHMYSVEELNDLIIERDRLKQELVENK